MAREHCFYEDIFNYIVHGTYWAGANDVEKDKLHKEATNYSVIQGNLFHTSVSTKKLQWVITKESDQKRAIFECHIKDTGDHLNAKTTCINLRKKYHWKNIDNDVNNFIKSCQECNSMENVEMCDSKLNDPIEFLDRVWKLVEVDVIGPLVFHEKEMFLLRLTDIFSNWMSYNFLGEINFKDISNMLLDEFSTMGFPTGIRLVGVENSEKFIDIFEVALKDFMDNVKKINLILNKDNKSNDDNFVCSENHTQPEDEAKVVTIEVEMKSCENRIQSINEIKTINASSQSKNCDKDGETVIETENPTMDDHKETMLKNKDDNDKEESIQTNIDSSNIQENVKINTTSERNGNMSIDELDIKNYENSCEVNDDTEQGRIESKAKKYENGIEQNSEVKDATSIKPEIKNSENIQMEDKTKIITIESEIKNSENDTQMEDKAKIATIEPEMKNCENDTKIIVATKLGTVESEMKNCENDVEFNNEIKAANVPSQIKNCENIEIITAAVQQETAYCEKTESSNEDKISMVETETNNLKYEPSNDEASKLQQNSLTSDIAQLLCNKEDEVKFDTNAIISELSQNENDSHKQNNDPLDNILVVKRIKESENTFKELSDFETFFKSSAAKENCERPLIYFFLAQQSLLDNETQNIRRTYLQEFIKLFPDSWTDNLSYFNFHIRNTLSTLFQTPCQLLLHRDPYLLRLYKSKNLNESFQYSHLQKGNLHADHINRTPNGSPESKQIHIPVRDGYTMRPLSTSTSVRRHSRYGLRKTPKPNDSLGFSHQYIKSQKRSAGEEAKQKDYSPPLKTRRLSSCHSKRLNSIKQRTIENILKNYSLKSPIILLTPLPCSVVDSILHGTTNTLSLEKYIQLSCKSASKELTSNSNEEKPSVFIT